MNKYPENSHSSGSLGVPEKYPKKIMTPLSALAPLLFHLSSILIHCSSSYIPTPCTLQMAIIPEFSRLLQSSSPLTLKVRVPPSSSGLRQTIGPLVRHVSVPTCRFPLNYLSNTIVSRYQQNAGPFSFLPLLYVKHCAPGCMKWSHYSGCGLE